MLKDKNIFITGTDTSVGKTIAAAALTYALDGLYWKPIQSGLEDDRSDPSTVEWLTGLSKEHFIETQYAFKASLSPDQAAILENQKIELASLNLPLSPHRLIIEGAGGINVPLNENELMLDLIKKFNLPVIIVARGTLGTINHTLLSIEVLRSHKISILGVIFSGELTVANQKAIERWGKVKTLFHIPQFSNLDLLSSWIKLNKNNIERHIYELEAPR